MNNNILIYFVYEGILLFATMKYFPSFATIIYMASYRSWLFSQSFRVLPFILVPAYRTHRALSNSIGMIGRTVCSTKFYPFWWFCIALTKSHGRFPEPKMFYLILGVFWRTLNTLSKNMFRLKNFEILKKLYPKWDWVISLFWLHCNSHFHIVKPSHHAVISTQLSFC